MEPTTEASAYFRTLQTRICAAVEAADGQATFSEDTWARMGGGGGCSRVLQGGAVFEKAGVGWSEVHGTMEPAFADRLPGSSRQFHACGISLVFHPRSPMIPTVHANFRSLSRGDASWFGGGADLTPYYPFREDVIHFHDTWKGVCDQHNGGFYPRFKAWCDAYFFLPHRNETRGVGGIFFDYLGISPQDAASVAAHEAKFLWPIAVATANAFAFVRDAGDAFTAAYLPIVERRRTEPYGESERDFQLIRRGRYAEFNLLYDRGTVFGLRTGGRTESILMSMPPLARWVYDYHPPAGSREATLWEYLHPQEWLST